MSTCKRVLLGLALLVVCASSLAVASISRATLGMYGAQYQVPQLKHIDDNARRQDFTWDGAGRAKSAVLTGAEQSRASHIVYDTAGRLAESKFGQGDATSLAHEFGRLSNGYGSGNSDLPVSSAATEDGTHTQNWSLGYDTLGQTTHAGIDGKDFSFEHHSTSRAMSPRRRLRRAAVRRRTTTMPAVSRPPSICREPRTRTSTSRMRAGC